MSSEWTPSPTPPPPLETIHVETRHRGTLPDASPMAVPDTASTSSSSAASSSSTSSGSSSWDVTRQVDICVTCLTSKPPTLPLREELPSLGVEVIYQARGKAWRTARHLARKQLRQYRQEQQIADITKRRWFPKSQRHIQAKVAERHRMERHLKIPHAVSYQSYQRPWEEESTLDSASTGGGLDSTTSSRQKNSNMTMTPTTPITNKGQPMDSSDPLVIYPPSPKNQQQYHYHKPPRPTSNTTKAPIPSSTAAGMEEERQDLEEQSVARSSVASSSLAEQQQPQQQQSQRTPLAWNKTNLRRVGTSALRTTKTGGASSVASKSSTHSPRPSTPPPQLPVLSSSSFHSILSAFQQQADQNQQQQQQQQPSPRKGGGWKKGTSLLANTTTKTTCRTPHQNDPEEEAKMEIIPPFDDSLSFPFNDDGDDWKDAAPDNTQRFSSTNAKEADVEDEEQTYTSSKRLQDILASTSSGGMASRSNKTPNQKISKRWLPPPPPMATSPSNMSSSSLFLEELTSTIASVSTMSTSLTHKPSLRALLERDRAVKKQHMAAAAAALAADAQRQQQEHEQQEDSQFAPLSPTWSIPQSPSMEPIREQTPAAHMVSSNKSAVSAASSRPSSPRRPPPSATRPLSPMMMMMLTTSQSSTNSPGRESATTTQHTTTTSSASLQGRFPKSPGAGTAATTASTASFSPSSTTNTSPRRKPSLQELLEQDLRATKLKRQGAGGGGKRPTVKPEQEPSRHGTSNQTNGTTAPKTPVGMNIPRRNDSHAHHPMELSPNSDITPSSSMFPPLSPKRSHTLASPPTSPQVSSQYSSATTTNDSKPSLKALLERDRDYMKKKRTSSLSPLRPPQPQQQQSGVSSPQAPKEEGELYTSGSWSTPNRNRVSREPHKSHDHLEVVPSLGLSVASTQTPKPSSLQKKNGPRAPKQQKMSRVPRESLLHISPTDSGKEAEIDQHQHAKTFQQASHDSEWREQPPPTAVWNASMNDTSQSHVRRKPGRVAAMVELYTSLSNGGDDPAEELEEEKPLVTTLSSPEIENHASDDKHLEFPHYGLEETVAQFLEEQMVPTDGPYADTMGNEELFEEYDVHTTRMEEILSESDDLKEDPTALESQEEAVMPEPEGHVESLEHASNRASNESWPNVFFSSMIHLSHSFHSTPGEERKEDHTESLPSQMEQPHGPEDTATLGIKYSFPQEAGTDVATSDMIVDSTNPFQEPDTENAIAASSLDGTAVENATASSIGEEDVKSNPDDSTLLVPFPPPTECEEEGVESMLVPFAHPSGNGTEAYTIVTDYRLPPHGPLFEATFNNMVPWTGAPEESRELLVQFPPPDESQMVVYEGPPPPKVDDLLVPFPSQFSETEVEHSGENEGEDSYPHNLALIQKDEQDHDEDTIQQLQDSILQKIQAQPELKVKDITEVVSEKEEENSVIEEQDENDVCLNSYERQTKTTSDEKGTTFNPFATLDMLSAAISRYNETYLAQQVNYEPKETIMPNLTVEVESQQTEPELRNEIPLANSTLSLDSAHSDHILNDQMVTSPGNHGAETDLEPAPQPHCADEIGIIHDEAHMMTASMAHVDEKYDLERSETEQVDETNLRAQQLLQLGTQILSKPRARKDDSPSSENSDSKQGTHENRPSSDDTKKVPKMQEETNVLAQQILERASRILNPSKKTTYVESEQVVGGPTPEKAATAPINDQEQESFHEEHGDSDDFNIVSARSILSNKADDPAEEDEDPTNAMAKKLLERATEILHKPETKVNTSSDFSPDASTSNASVANSPNSISDSANQTDKQVNEPWIENSESSLDDDNAPASSTMKNDDIPSEGNAGESNTVEKAVSVWKAVAADIFSTVSDDFSSGSSSASDHNDSVRKTSSEGSIEETGSDVDKSMIPVEKSQRSRGKKQGNDDSLVASVDTSGHGSSEDHTHEKSLDETISELHLLEENSESAPSTKDGNEGAKMASTEDSVHHLSTLSPYGLEFVSSVNEESDSDASKTNGDSHENDDEETNVAPMSTREDRQPGVKSEQAKPLSGESTSTESVPEETREKEPRTLDAANHTFQEMVDAERPLTEHSDHAVTTAVTGDTATEKETANQDRDNKSPSFLGRPNARFAQLLSRLTRHKAIAEETKKRQQNANAASSLTNDQNSSIAERGSLSAESKTHTKGERSGSDVTSGVHHANESSMSDSTNKGSRQRMSMDSHNLAMLLDLLSGGESSVDDIKRILVSDPLMAQLKRHTDGRLALHCICSSRLQDRKSKWPEKYNDSLVNDIESLYAKIEVVVNHFAPACELVDRGGDLPVHLLARNLMKWETTWYERIYEQAAGDNERSGEANQAITKLYHSMSRCIDIVLSPVVKHAHLCGEPGSFGELLPLHIATIFTVPVKTLRQALETYPAAASEPCNVSEVTTFVPDGCLPVELHDSLSTDYPKWEITASSGPKLKWSKIKNTPTSREDAISRSDLLFAYNPVEPFISDETRLQRYESRILFEAQQVRDDQSLGLTVASELVWVWFCSNSSPGGDRDSNTSRVKRIVNGLPLDLVQKLGEAKAPNGANVLDVATKASVAIIKNRLGKSSDSSLVTDGSSGVHSSIRSDALSSKTADYPMGYLCREFFNVRDFSVPTSFVILPYMLARLDDGTVGMASPESAPAAMKFAEYLLQLTDPCSILYYVDAKSKKEYGISLYEQADDETLREDAFEKIEEFEEEVLAFYKKGKGYFYLIDENNGFPVVGESDSSYPFVLDDPATVVSGLLPLMLVGMIQMRGEKALSLLATSLLDDSITAVPQHWEAFAKDIDHQIRARNYSKDADEYNEYQDLKEGMLDFTAQIPSKQKRHNTPLHGRTEWGGEMSVLKTLYSHYDPNTKFCGLKTETEEDGSRVFWTVTTSAAEDSQDDATSGSDTQRSSVYLSEASREEYHATGKHDTRTQVRDESQGAPLMFFQPADDQKSRTVANEQRSRDDSSASVFTSSSPVEAMQNQDEPKEHRNETVSVENSSLSLLLSETEQVPDQTSSVASRDSDCTGVVSNTTKSLSPPDVTDLSSVPEKYSRKLHSKSDSSAARTGSVSQDSLGGENEVDDDERSDTRYGDLFDELSVSRLSHSEHAEETFDPEYDTLQVWNAAEGVWEDVAFQLDHSGKFMEDKNVTGLKVKLLEEAKKLSDLHNRVKQVTAKGNEVRDRLYEDIVDDDDESQGVRSLLEKRKLLLRLCDLEERLLCAEIGSQHTSMDSFALLQNLKGMTTTVRNDLESSMSSSRQEESIGTSMVPGAIGTRRPRRETGRAKKTSGGILEEHMGRALDNACLSWIKSMSNEDDSDELRSVTALDGHIRAGNNHKNSRSPSPPGKAPYSPPDRSTSTTQPLSPEAMASTYHTLSSASDRNSDEGDWSIMGGKTRKSTKQQQDPFAEEPQDTYSRHNINNRMLENPPWPLEEDIPVSMEIRRKVARTARGSGLPKQHQQQQYDTPRFREDEFSYLQQPRLQSHASLPEESEKVMPPLPRRAPGPRPRRSSRRKKRDPPSQTFIDLTTQEERDAGGDADDDQDDDGNDTDDYYATDSSLASQINAHRRMKEQQKQRQAQQEQRKQQELQRREQEERKLRRQEEEREEQLRQERHHLPPMEDYSQQGEESHGTPSSASAIVRNSSIHPLDRFSSSDASSSAAAAAAAASTGGRGATTTASASAAGAGTTSSNASEDFTRMLGRAHIDLDDMSEFDNILAEAGSMHEFLEL